VALSTTDAKYIALTEVIKEAIGLQGLMDDLEIKQDFVQVHCDSMSAIYLAKTKSIMRGRSILISSITLCGTFLKMDISR